MLNVGVDDESTHISTQSPDLAAESNSGGERVPARGCQDQPEVSSLDGQDVGTDASISKKDVGGLRGKLRFLRKGKLYRLMRMETVKAKRCFQSLVSLRKMRMMTISYKKVHPT